MLLIIAPYSLVTIKLYACVYKYRLFFCRAPSPSSTRVLPNGVEENSSIKGASGFPLREAGRGRWSPKKIAPCISSASPTIFAVRPTLHPQARGISFFMRSASSWHSTLDLRNLTPPPLLAELYHRFSASIIPPPLLGEIKLETALEFMASAGGVGGGAAVGHRDGSGEWIRSKEND